MRVDRGATFYLQKALFCRLKTFNLKEKTHPTGKQSLSWDFFFKNETFNHRYHYVQKFDN